MATNVRPGRLQDRKNPPERGEGPPPDLVSGSYLNGPHFEVPQTSTMFEIPGYAITGVLSNQNRRWAQKTIYNPFFTH